MAPLHPASSRGHVCVIGAGIVGCASAYALARSGWKVTLVDALPAPGHGASFANGAQLSFSYVEPLASPSTLRSLPALLASPNSPLRWRPRADWTHMRWLMSFLTACRGSQVQRTTEALLSLAFLSRDTLHTWLNEQPHLASQAKHTSTGKLVVYRDPFARAAVQRQLLVQRALGCSQRLVEAAECIAIEPALAAAAQKEIAFGVWTADEEAVDAALLAQALAHASGASLSLGRRVTGLEVEDNTVRAVRVGAGRIEADHFVVAAGNGSGQLLRPCGIHLPIESIKGYSITVPVINPDAAPQVNVTDQARKIVYARLGNELRVAGFAELVGADTSLNLSRIQALCAAVNGSFPGACDTRDPQGWAGLRPATPGGRPLIGATPLSNLWLNTGHGGLGLTLAPGSAALLVQLMARERPGIDPRPYGHLRGRHGLSAPLRAKPRVQEAHHV